MARQDPALGADPMLELRALGGRPGAFHGEDGGGGDREDRRDAQEPRHEAPHPDPGGVDLAHVGPRFGDEIDLNPALEKRIEDEDRKSLAHALKLEADPFYLSVVADGHWRKVCGLSATYTALRWLKLLGAPEGRLLTYGQAPDPSGGIVSFASLIF